VRIARRRLSRAGQENLLRGNERGNRTVAEHIERRNSHRVEWVALQWKTEQQQERDGTEQHQLRKQIKPVCEDGEEAEQLEERAQGLVGRSVTVNATSPRVM
jgi:hypothetical protein